MTIFDQLLKNTREVCVSPSPSLPTESLHKHFTALLFVKQKPVLSHTIIFTQRVDAMSCIGFD